MKEQPRVLASHAASQASDKGGVLRILVRTCASREFGQAPTMGQVEHAPKAPEPPGIAGTLPSETPGVGGLSIPRVA